MMAQATAPKRSIDEIIGSIRSIVDRSPSSGRRHLDGANDPGIAPVEPQADLTALPDDAARFDPPSDVPSVDPRAYAEPVAPQPVAYEAAEVYAADDLSAISSRVEQGTARLREEGAARASDFDAAQMAEIAAAVERNLAEVEASFVGGSHSDATVDQERRYARSDDVSVEIAASPSVRAEVERPTFGRRSSPASRPLPERTAPTVEFTPAVPQEETTEASLETELEAFLAEPEPTEVKAFAQPAADGAPHSAIAALHAKVSEMPSVDATATAAPAATSLVAPSAIVEASLPAVATPMIGPGAVADPVLDDAMLRPIIREWLDDNLPPLVERLVREELERAVTGRR